MILNFLRTAPTVYEQDMTSVMAINVTLAMAQAKALTGLLTIKRIKSS
ncbi:hypothetical protein ACIQXV_26740 [Neobacillus sp. NPDC097160]